MLEKVWGKIDKFYLVLFVVMTLSAVLVIVVFKGVFSSYLNAYEINQKDLQVDAKIQKESLEEAYNWFSNKQTIHLKVRD
jgi:uncharacterized ion transporter superfamily protein YfcC